jgi:pimeloyl-ACP methyl ester carboxylesterase
MKHIFGLMLVLSLALLPALAPAPASAQGGIDYNVVDVGSPTMVVLVPGAFHCAEHFAPMQAALAAKGQSSAAISLRGHCGSPMPPGQVVAQATLADYVTDVANVIETEGWESVELWGHSAGSLVIRAFGLTYGNQGGQIVKVVHLAPAPMTANRLNAMLGYYQANFPAEMACFFTTFSMTCLRDALASTFTNNLTPAQWAPWEALLTDDESAEAFVAAQALLGVDAWPATPEVIRQPIADRTLPAAFIQDDAAMIGATLQMVGCGLGHDDWLDASLCDAKGR